MKSKKELNDFFQKNYDGVTSNVIYNSSNLTKTKLFEQSYFSYVGRALSEDNNAFEIFENGSKTNAEILDEYLVKLRSGRFKNVVILLELNREKDYSDFILLLDRLKMFMDFVKSQYMNMVIPIFLDMHEDFHGTAGLEMKLNCFNVDDNFSIINLFENDIIDDKLTLEGHERLGTYLVKFIVTSTVNQVLSKRDDMRIQIFDIEQQLFKVYDKTKELERNMDSYTAEKRVEEYKLKKEEAERSLFRETQLRIMTKKKLEIQETIVKNNYPDEFKKFDSMKQEIQSLKDQNLDLRDNLFKFQEENSKLKELNPSKPII